MTDPMVEFVLACADEREKAASAATPGPWTLRPYWFTSPAGRSYATVEGVIYEEIDVEDGVHIALNDPARVLARCAADRKIAEQAAYWIERAQSRRPDMTPKQRAYVNCRAEGARQTLRLLVLANADHPNFRPEWKL